MTKGYAEHYRLMIQCSGSSKLIPREYSRAGKRSMVGAGGGNELTTFGPSNPDGHSQRSILPRLCSIARMKAKRLKFNKTRGIHSRHCR